MNNILNSTSNPYTSSYMRAEEEIISPEEVDPRTQHSMQLHLTYNSNYNPNSSSLHYYSPIQQHNLDLPLIPPPLNYTSDQYDLPPPLAPNTELHSNSSQLGLELGHRPYYPSTESSWALAQFFKSRGCYYGFGGQSPRCQAEGCKADLMNAKRYHRRHKVCEPHSKAAVVHLGGGIMQRFCQQCSRFHMLDEFDDSKKSCRKRLADHNRRRRKPKPDSPVPYSILATPINTTQANAAIPREQEVQRVPKSKGKAINTRGWLHAGIICSSKSGYETGRSGSSSGA